MIKKANTIKANPNQLVCKINQIYGKMNAMN